MYVNTLITLQENAPTYGMDGRNLMGHITLNSPGRIMCYVQNLKSPSNGTIYGLYLFSKKHGKGIRIGELGHLRETKWLVNEKNINESGLALTEIDGVAIVAELAYRGTEMILSGFKENRYMIIPMIEDLFNKTKKPVSTQSKRASQHIGKVILPDPIHTTTSQTIDKKPMMVPEEPGPVSSPLVDQKPNEEGPMMIPEEPGPVISPLIDPKPNEEEPMMVPEEPGPVISPLIDPKPNEEGPMMIPEEPGPVSSPLVDQKPNEEGPMMIPEEPGPVSSPLIDHESNEEGPMMVPEEPGPVISPLINHESNEEGPMTVPEEPGPVVDPYGFQETDVSPSKINDINQMAANETLKDSLIKKVKILEEEFSQIQITEDFSDINIKLLKIAEELQEVEKDPAIKKTIQSGIPQASTSVPDASVVRKIDEAENPLKSIIARLKVDERVQEKAKDIEEQIEKMKMVPQKNERYKKSSVEQTIERKYMAQQEEIKEEEIKEEEIKEDRIEEEIEEEWDSSPRCAHLYLAHQRELEKEIASIQESEENEKEIDYLEEIDKKIKEIEEKRKQEIIGRNKRG